MRENRLYGSEGGESQLNAISLPLSLVSRLESSLQLADTQKIVQSATIESSFATMVKGGPPGIPEVVQSTPSRHSMQRLVMQ